MLLSLPLPLALPDCVCACVCVIAGAPPAPSCGRRRCDTLSRALPLSLSLSLSLSLPPSLSPSHPGRFAGAAGREQAVRGLRPQNAALRRAGSWRAEAEPPLVRPLRARWPSGGDQPERAEVRDMRAEAGLLRAAALHTEAVVRRMCGCGNHTHARARACAHTRTHARTHTHTPYRTHAAVAEH